MNMIKKCARTGITLALGFLTLQVYAAGDDDHAKHGQAVNHAGKAQGVAQDMTEGEIRKVDKDGKKITIKHGEIRNLDMPAMTMVFQVRDASWLDKLQPADKVKFKVINDGGKFTVVDLQIVK